jgi:hypothetical protein
VERTYKEHTKNITRVRLSAKYYWWPSLQTPRLRPMVPRQRGPFALAFKVAVKESFMHSESAVRFILSGALLASAAAAPARSSSCDRDVVAHIKMAPGQGCWTYRGAATTFVGDFAHGQRIAAQMMGRASEYDPRTGGVASFWRARDPNVEGPGGFFFGDAEAPGALTFVAPANGTYRFSFSPCAMWGAPGAVKICAR